MILTFPPHFLTIGDTAIKTYASETIIYNLKGSFFQKFSDNIRPLKTKIKNKKPLAHYYKITLQNHLDIRDDDFTNIMVPLYQHM